MKAKEYFIEHLSGEPLHQDVVIDAMIEFAKYHVELALKSASKNVIVYNYRESDTIKINKPSILNSYPLKNIK